MRSADSLSYDPPKCRLASQRNHPRFFRTKKARKSGPFRRCVMLGLPAEILEERESQIGRRHHGVLLVPTHERLHQQIGESDGVEVKHRRAGLERVRRVQQYAPLRVSPGGLAAIYRPVGYSPG